MRTKVAAALIILLLCCCENKNKVQEADDLSQPVIAINNKNETYDDIYSVYTVDEDYVLSLYEPKEGCYLGAYILSNRNVDFDIKTFEQMTNKEHCSYIYNMKLGETFPGRWVLECYSLMKTPCIVLEPPSYSDPYQYEFLESCAKQFGELYIPIFLQFYPDPSKYGDAESYINFYREARRIFRENASNVSFVWSVSIDDVYRSSDYYPSNENVDWVGVNIYKTVDDTKNIDAALDFFYFTYQRQKPIMVSQLAISHFTSSGHEYYTAEATEEITKIYSSVINKYPRIKAVYYMDFNNLEVSPSSDVRDNFSITDNETVLKSYERATTHEHFLNKLSIMDSGDLHRESIKSKFLAYKKGDKFYVSEKTLLYDLNIYDLSKISESAVTINGSNYYTDESLFALGLTVSSDIMKRAVIINKGLSNF